MLNLTDSDIDQVIMLGSSASLADTAKKDSWIENVDGELPKYVREVARSIMKTGKTKSQAIAIAISRIKKWAATGEGDTKAKATKALAEWESLKGKAKGKKVAKLSNRTGQMEMLVRPVELIALSGPSYNIDNVRRAYDDMMREARRAARAASPHASYDDYPYYWVKEVWNTHLIIENADGGSQQLFKVDYTVDSSGNPTFKEPVEVVIEYVEAGKDIADSELEPALG